MAQNDKPLSPAQIRSSILLNTVKADLALLREQDIDTQASGILVGIARVLGVRDLSLVPETLNVLQGIYATRNGIPLDLADRAIKILEAEGRSLD